jgi:cobalt/nickel transport system permease protein
VLVMTCVVALQALLFADGGIVVMGANIFNMGVLTAVIGAIVFRVLLGILGRARWSIAMASFAAAWVSVMAAALATSLQLIASNTVQAAVVLPAMLAVHAVIGIGEGLITASALGFLLATRPDLLPASIGHVTGGRGRTARTRGIVLGGLALAAVLVLLSPFASAAPDGLERVAENLGFLETERGPVVQTPAGVLPDYTVPGLAGEQLSTILAGLIGVVIVVALAYGVTLLLRRRDA